MAVLKEKYIEEYLCKEMNKYAGKAYKFVSPSNAGVPDRLVILPNGDVLFVELKRHGEKARPSQEVQIRRLVKLKQKVYVVSGLLGLEKFFQEIGMEESANRIRKRIEKGDL